VRLEDVLRVEDKVIVPWQPSMFDTLVTQAFLQKVTGRQGKLAVEDAWLSARYAQ
jgi:chromosome partitioning protein